MHKTTSATQDDIMLTALTLTVNIVSIQTFCTCTRSRLTNQNPYLQICDSVVRWIKKCRVQFTALHVSTWFL